MASTSGKPTLLDYIGLLPFLVVLIASLCLYVVTIIFNLVNWKGDRGIIKKGEPKKQFFAVGVLVALVAVAYWLCSPFISFSFANLFTVHQTQIDSAFYTRSIVAIFYFALICLSVYYLLSERYKKFPRLTKFINIDN